MRAFVAILVLSVLVVLTLVLVAWILISRSHYTTTLLTPGCRYEVDGRVYQFPNIPIVGKAYLLKDYYIRDIRTIFRRTRRVLLDMGIPNWPTGGSLIGVQRHGAFPMPMDDDGDLAVDMEHRRRLYDDDEFSIKCAAAGLRVIFLFGNGTHRADVHGSAVRVQLADPKASHATVDVFFWRHDKKQNKMIKVDGWVGDTVYDNPIEAFDYNDVFPLRRVCVDDMELDLPHRPLNLLKQQYGPTVMDIVYTRPLLISHVFPFAFLSAFWRPKPTWFASDPSTKQIKK